MIKERGLKSGLINEKGGNNYEVTVLSYYK